MAEAYLAWDLLRLERRRDIINRRQSARHIRDDQNALLLEDNEFLNRYRVSKELFMELTEVLRPALQRQRPYGLSTETQILTALRFYATGCYQTPIGLQWGSSMSQKSVSRVIHRVTEAINIHLLREYIKFPTTTTERQRAKQKFANCAHPFSDTIGAIDCTHVKILGHRVHEEAYVSGHHEGHSLNVQAVCDPDLLILNMNARWPGCRHDAHIWANSPVRSSMKRHFESGDRRAWLLGDDGYPLEPWLMTPLKNQPPNSPEYRYTQAHCSARNVVERCFGVLKSTFRCLSRQRQLMYEPNIAGQIINACAVLHNMRIMYKLHENDIQTPEQLSDEDHSERGNTDSDTEVNGAGRAVAERIRKRIISSYFN